MTLAATSRASGVDTPKLNAKNYDGKNGNKPMRRFLSEVRAHIARQPWYETTKRAYRKQRIHDALKVLLDPEIPDIHEPNNHNCGECYACIEGTIVLGTLLRRERARNQENKH